jgi:hypothetical protein
MTREQLAREANGLIAVAKATVEMQGDFDLTILIHAKGEWARLPFPKEFEALMNNGKAKDQIFGALRETVRRIGADGVIIACDTWCSTTTPEGKKHLDTPEWRELHDTGFVTLMQRGWVTRCEAFTITAQNATEALLVQQTYQRLDSGMIQLLDCKREWFDQDHFDGRQKMYGDLKWQNLGSDAAVKGGPHA